MVSKSTFIYDQVVAKPHANERPSTTYADRFWSYVDKRGDVDCWLWRGQICSDGYGGCAIPNPRGHRATRAHRAAWEIANRRHIPEGLMVLHSCDTPLCCNPNHLRIGTVLDNSADMVARDRAARGDRHGTKIHPASIVRGDRHWTRMHPDKVVRGDQHPSRTRPEMRPRGDTHYSRTNPERLARGDRSGRRKHPESYPKGERVNTAKLTEHDVRAIRASGESAASLATRFGVTDVTIRHIRRRITWKHVT